MKTVKSGTPFLSRIATRYFLIPVLGSVIAFLVIFLSEEEKKGGIPAVLRQMDLWSEMRTYPNKVMDASEFNSSFLLSKAMLASQAAPNSPNSIMATPWIELGPKNFSGRILSIGFHPTDPNTMWVGSASGGLWKTTTGGTGGPGGISWTYVPTGFPVLGVSSIVVNPLNGNEIYIGTGEVYNSTPGGSTGAGHIRLFRGSYGIGILKSVDGGVTWTKTLDFTNSSLKGVMDMVIHPTTPATVFAATTDGIYRTTNSGTSWTLIHNVTYAMDLVFKPGDPNVLYSGSGNFLSANNGIWKTTNANAATPTFTKLTSASFPNPISGKIMLAMSAANPDRIYASIGKDPNTSDGQGLFVSNDQGATWAGTGVANMLGTQGWYAHDIAVSQSNANNLIWAELNTYRSTNGGTSTTNTGIWSQWDINNTTVGDLTEGVSNATNYVHADVHRISPSPHNTNTFFLCTDGGLFRTTDNGATFNTLNGGLNTAQIYADMTVHPSNANYMLIGLQDNEAAVYEGNAGFRRIGNLGDGFHAAMNFNGTIQLVESYYFNRRRSTNSGGTWGGGSGAVPATENACFNVPMVFSRAASSVYMYAGTNVFKRSANSGSTWTNFTNAGNPIAGSLCPAIAMVAPTNDIVYFSTGPGGGVRSKLWKTTNATAVTPVFTEITGTLPDRYYSGIDVDPTDPNRLFVTLSGFGSSHIYMSVNGGTTWSDLGTGLPNVPHNSVFINPSARGQVYVANDLGVFVANNIPLTGPLGATTSVYWNNFSQGMGDAVMAADILVTNTGKLRLATYGRGIWETDLASLTLPIVMKQFKAWEVQTGNQLDWTVSSQQNVKQYEVEYSTDGSRFSKITTIAAITGSGDITYKYLHTDGKNSDAFYRIKTVDNDGAFKYSNVELVKAQRLLTKITAYPNPTTGVFNIRLNAPINGTFDIKVYNSIGSLMMQEKQTVRQGNNNLSMNISRLAPGNYQVVCEGQNRKWVTTILKN